MLSAEFQCGALKSTVPVDSQASLLDQALLNGVEVNFACRRGDCGQCAATVMEGDVTAIEPSRPSRMGRRVLLCNVAASSSVRIDLPYLPELRGIKTLRSPSKIHTLKLLSEDVMEVVLRLPPSTAFVFLPGQYIRITNRQQTTRSYSLAAGQQSDRMLRLHVRKIDGGRFGDWLFHEAKPNDLLQLEGPLGHFFLRESGSYENSLFVATGTGIAPLYAMLSSLDDEQRRRCGDIHIYWGNRVSKDAYLQHSLLELAARWGWSLNLIYSREGDGGGNRHVQDAVAARHPRLELAQVFVAGNPGMVDAMRQLANDRGLAESNFHADPFTTS